MRESKYSTALLRPIVQDSHSIGEVLRKLNLRATGGNHRMITCRIRVTGLSTAHFRGKGWSRGETKQTHPVVAHIAACQTRPDEQVFLENSPVICGYRLIR